MAEKRKAVELNDEMHLVHGTTKENWENIKNCGIHKMSRQHIHFVLPRHCAKSDGRVPVRTPYGSWEDTARDVLIYVNRARAEKDGIVFYEHRNGGDTVLTPGLKSSGAVPLAYVDKVIEARTGDVLCEPVGACLLPAPPVKRGRTGLPWAKRFFKVDFHTHILPKSLDICKGFEEEGYITLEPTPSGRNMLRNGQLFRAIKDNCYDPDAILKDMKANDIDVQVISTVPVMFCYWTKNKKDAEALSRYLNDDMAAVVKKNPKKFIALGQLPLQFPDLAVEEMTRCVKELGFKTFQIGSHVNKWELSDEHLFPVFKAAEELDVGIMVHPWEMMGAAEHGNKYWLPWLVGMPAETCRAMCHIFFAGILNKLPKLRIMFAHGGGSFAYTAGRIQHGYNCRPDLCATDAPEGPASYLANSTRPARFWVDTLTHDEEAMRFLVNKMGEDRVVMGSDYPFPLGEWVPGRLVEEMTGDGWSDERKRKLLASNSFDFLGLDPNDYY